MKQINIHVDDTTPEFQYMEAEARRRGISLTGFARRLFDVIAKDRMVNGILDDEDEVAVAKPKEPTVVDTIRNRSVPMRRNGAPLNFRTPVPADPTGSSNYQRDAYTPARDRGTHPTGKSGLRDLLADAVKNT